MTGQAHKPAIEVVRVGAEGEPVVVIDGFVRDPDALAETATGAAFAPMGEFYPGPRAAAPPSYPAEVGPLVAAAARRVFGCREQVRFTRALFSLVTTPPDRLSLAQRVPHVDGVDPGMIAIVHYLSRDDQGGTSFYRHRSTGFETVDADRQRRYLDALRADFDRLGEPPPGYIGGDTSIFERIATFEPRYNRALVYRSKLLHCAAPPSDRALSADPRRGRLTIASFLVAK